MEVLLQRGSWGQSRIGNLNTTGGGWGKQTKKKKRKMGRKIRKVNRQWPREWAKSKSTNFSPGYKCARVCSHISVLVGKPRSPTGWNQKQSPRESFTSFFNVQGWMRPLTRTFKKISKNYLTRVSQKIIQSLKRIWRYYQCPNVLLSVRLSYRGEKTAKSDIWSHVHGPLTLHRPILIRTLKSCL